MNGDPKEPQPDPGTAGTPRQDLPPASPAVRSPLEERRERSTAARLAGAGLQFAITILVCLWLGTWLDRQFGTTPVFLYVGVFLGAGAAFYSMYRQLMANLERDEAAKPARKGADDRASPGSSRGSPGDQP